MSHYSEFYDNDVRDLSQPFLSSPFEIDLAIFEDSSSSGEDEMTPPNKKRKVTPVKKDAATSMQGLSLPSKQISVLSTREEPYSCN